MQMGWRHSFKATKGMDVVIPHGTGSYWDCNELRYCLRSIDKNFRSLGDIYVVGYKPGWLKNVKHIDALDLYPDNKGASIIAKVLKACNDKRVSGNFLFISDDQCFLKSMSATSIKPYYTYDLSSIRIGYSNRRWRECMVNVKRTLRKSRMPCYNYETHAPKIFNKTRFIEVMKKYDWQNIQYPTHTLYFNNNVILPKQMPDKYRIFFNAEKMDVNLIKGYSFLAYSDLGLSWQLQKKLKELFPRKSRFER